MKPLIAAFLLSLPLVTTSLAEPATDVVGDYTFPNAIEGMPATLANFAGLEINSFTTNDGIRLNYWRQDRATRSCSCPHGVPVEQS